MCVCVCICVQLCACVREMDNRKEALLKTQKRSILVTASPSPSSSSTVCLSPQWKCLVKRPDMNSFYAEMKLIMPTICYRQLAARTAAATQRGMQHQLESCRCRQWDTWCHLGIDGWPFSELSIACPPFTEQLFLRFCKRQVPKVTWQYSDREECRNVVVIFVLEALGEDKFDSNCHYFANPFSEWCRIISCC